MSDLSLRAKQHGILVLAEDVDRLFCQAKGGEVPLSDPAARQFSLAFSRALNQISGVGSTGLNPPWVDYNHHLKAAQGEDPKWREKMAPLVVIALRSATEAVVGKGLAGVIPAWMSADDFLPPLPPPEEVPSEETPDAPPEADLNDDLLEAVEALGLG